MRRCKNCNIEMSEIDIPKEVFSFKLFGREFMLLHMNAKDYMDLCIDCASDKEQTKFQDIYYAGYHDAMQEVSKNDERY